MSMRTIERLAHRYIYQPHNICIFELPKNNPRRTLQKQTYLNLNIIQNEQTISDILNHDHMTFVFFYFVFFYFNELQ